MKRCTDCRDGEHENYDDNVQRMVVRDPDSMEVLKTTELCDYHKEMYASDGYEVYPPVTGAINSSQLNKLFRME